MSKNGAQLKTAIKELAIQPYEVRSGTVVAGSLDTTEYTITVQTEEEGAAIAGVRLNGITGTDSGCITYPKEGSHVVIASINGPGEWVLLQASELTEAVLKIGAVTVTINEAAIRAVNSNVILDIGDTVFKMNTASESLHGLLKDLLTHIKAITVTTSMGPSGLPINLADFVALEARLDNLLAS